MVFFVDCPVHCDGRGSIVNQTPCNRFQEESHFKETLSRVRVGNGILIRVYVEKPTICKTRNPEVYPDWSRPCGSRRLTSSETDTQCRCTTCTVCRPAGRAKRYLHDDNRLGSPVRREGGPWWVSYSHQDVRWSLKILDVSSSPSLPRPKHRIDVRILKVDPLFSVVPSRRTVLFPDNINRHPGTS